MEIELGFIVGCIRLAGALHLTTLAIAYITPIPRDWDKNLAALPLTHRRFAIAQNVFIGGVIAVLGLVCLFFAEELASGDTLARVICGVIALWWAARLAVLPFLGVIEHLNRVHLRVGFGLLMLQCALYALFFALLAFGFGPTSG
jgi:Na+/H+ antiporter NhaD/arsenite permease-like protein